LVGAFSLGAAAIPEEQRHEAAKSKIFGTVTAKAGAKPKPEPKGKKTPAPAA